MNICSHIARFVPLAVLGIGIVLAPNASAQFGNCRQDLRNFCSDVARSDDRAKLQCLSQHKNELSAECRTQIETQSGVRQSKRQACRSDIGKFCSSVDRQDRRALSKCLREHESEITEECRASLAQRQ